MSPAPSQLKQLQRELASGQVVVVVVVGSGVSVAACGQQLVEGHQVASWRGLLEHGVERLSGIGAADGGEEMLRKMIRSGKTDFMISATGMITDRLKGLSDGIFRGWLSDSIGQLKLQDRTLLQDIAALPGLVATLNYDHLLVEETGRPAITWQETNAVQDVLRGSRQIPIDLQGLTVSECHGEPVLVRLLAGRLACRTTTARDTKKPLKLKGKVLKYGGLCACPNS